jgi:hypothetical protein
MIYCLVLFGWVLVHWLIWMNMTAGVFLLVFLLPCGVHAYVQATVLLIVIDDALLGRQHLYGCVLWCLTLVSPWLVMGKISWDSFGFGWDFIPPNQCLSGPFLLIFIVQVSLTLVTEQTASFCRFQIDQDLGKIK